MSTVKFVRPKNAPHRVIVALFAVMLSIACGASTTPAPVPGPGPTTNPCTGVVCSGHGDCGVQNDTAVCTCDSGYRVDGLSCKPSCDQCGSRVCGGDNGCGQTCGTCPSSSTCSAAGQCVSSPPPPPPPSKASLKVVNNSATTIWYLYVSPASSGSWGADQLGGNIISPGGSFTLNGIPCPGYYDLKVENSSRTAGATRYNVLFTCGVTNTWTLN